MSAIPLSAVGRGYVTLAPPWSNRLFKLGRLAWGPGEQPPQLAQYKATGFNPNLAKAMRKMAAAGATPMTGKDLEAYNKQRSAQGKAPRERTVATA